MKNKFITPVAMKVTREQFEGDLKESLRKLGYEIDNPDEYEYDYIKYTILVNDMTRSKGITKIGLIHKSWLRDHYFIDHYNPELYLALAAMTEGEEPIVGEYMTRIAGDIRTAGDRDIGRIFKIEKIYRLIYVESENILHLKKSCRKAAKEKLINHFTEQEKFILPDKWYIRVTEENQRLIGTWLMENENVYGNDDLHHHPSYIGVYFNYPKVKSSFPFASTVNYVLPRDYTKITFEQFKKYVLKENIMKKDKFPFKLLREDAQRIIGIACGEWKKKLAKKWANLLFEDSVEVSEDFYKEMRKDCTPEQHQLFDKIFGEDKPFPADGTPCLVRNCNVDGWDFRYSDGKGKFYFYGKKVGESGIWPEWRVLDMNNLPVND